MTVKLSLPLSEAEIKNLTAGQSVLLSGEIYTLRDAGHKRLVDGIKAGKPDFDVKNKAFYYSGPAPEKEGEPIGSCGPTTSSRMDDYTPFLLNLGLKVMIGKGRRSPEVIAAMVKNTAVYFAAVGGAGALYKSRVIKNEPIIYEDLGCEAMRKLTVKDMPLIVAIDCRGDSILK